MRASRLRIRSLASAPSLGNRRTETIDGTTRYYTYDNNDKLTAISGGGQSASLSYDSNGNPFDRLRASMTGVSGAVRDTYELDTFRRSVSSSGSTPNPYRGVYPERSRRGGAWGYLTDPSGMLQLGARFYWPEVGRFVSHDPIREGMNWYAYVGDNPVVWTDPTGLACVPYLKRHYKIRHNTDVGDWSTWTLTHVHYVELPYLPYNEVNCSWMRTRQLHGYYERYFKVWWLCWRPCKGAYTKVTESPHIKQWKTLTERQRTVTWHYGWVDEYQAVWWCRTHPPS